MSSLLQSKFKQTLIDNLIDKIDSPVVSVTINAGGSQYANGELLVFDSDDGTGAAGRVFTNGNGAIEYIALTARGNYVVKPTVTVDTANGVGASLTAVVENDHFYVFAGRADPYANEFEPDVAYENDYDAHFYQYDHMLFGKKVSNTDIAIMARRVQWTSNTEYAEYDDRDQELPSKDFFVITDDYHVFKCIYNNLDAPSTVQPANTSSSTLPATLADGYRWQYMYTVPAGDRSKFITQNYVPLKDDATVIANAANGAILNIKVEVAGSEYPCHSNSIVATSNGSNLVIVGTGASTVQDYYANCTLTVFGAGNVVTNRRIASSYDDNGSRTLILANTFNANQIAAGYTYSIAPSLDVDGDGADFEGYLVMNANNGAIVRAEIVDGGQDYARATANVVSGTAFGSGADLRPIISPPGGHGANARGELYARHLCVSATFANTMTGGQPTEMKYRSIGLLKNPEPYTGNTQVTGVDFNQTVTLTVANTSTKVFDSGEIILGNVSGARMIVAFSNSSIAKVTAYPADGEDPIIGEVLTGQESGAQFTLTNIGDAPDLKAFSGEVLYIQNVEPIQRSNTASEQCKLVIRL